MEETLFQIVNQKLADNIKHFEETYKHSETWEYFDYPIILLLECFNLESPTEKEDHCVLLASNILSDLFSVFILLRQGYIRPPAVVLRASIENLCTLIAIHKNEKTYEKFVSNKMDPNKDCVPKAKPEFEILPVLWGILSNEFVHEGFLSIGRALGQKGINIIPDFKNHIGQEVKQEESLLMMLPIVLDEFVSTLEWIFPHKLKRLKTFKLTPDGMLTKIHDPKILNHLKTFQDKLDKIKIENEE